MRFYEVEGKLVAAGLIVMANIYRNHYAVYRASDRTFVAQVSLVKDRFDVSDLNGGNVKRTRDSGKCADLILKRAEVSQ